MTSDSIHKLKGFGLMFLSSSLMGGIGAFARYINAPGDFIAFWRSFAGFIAMTLIFLLSGSLVQRAKKYRLSPSMVLSGIFLGLLSSLYVIGTQYTTLANASFLIYTGPVYSTILATIFLKEPFKPQMLGSLAAVVVGTLLIVGIVSENGISLDLDPKYAFGNMIALLSGVAYGLFLFFSRYRQDVDSNTRSWWNFIFAAGTIFIMVIVRWKGLTYPVRETVNGVPVGKLDNEGNQISLPWHIFEMDTRSWIVLLFAALFTGFGAFYCLTFASKILLAGELATISYQETIMASLLGFIMFHEFLTGLQLLGGAMIIVGGVSQVYFSTRNANKIKSKQPPTEEETSSN